ncbi:gliding motility-associated C-terminal domain-containing protein [Marivirga sericea]|uniref:Gliding motility-associated C-terminal domain-containing protein n=1 Tax=Marivirga sericea TaxID=1028 RepID=A0A1X7LDH6_9BACT|nr:gliding motility-associated C-terminal domain-containing protein [Marivirga sericea]SMG51918.1 gliding motility-associated C-terminal domain-containing protein [Marivirga sericea]
MKALYNICLLVIVVLLIVPESIIAQAPTTGASNFSVSNIEGNRIRLNWSRGDGSSILVIASESATFNGSGVPSDGTDYNAGFALGTGDQIGSGNFVVYRGSSSSFNLTDLEKSTTYYFRFYEFNGVDFGTEYNVSDVLNGSASTLSEPSLGPSNFTSTTTGNTASLGWARGNGSRTLVILQAGSEAPEPILYSNYFASSNFGSGTSIGSGEAVYFGTGVATNVTNLEPNTEYFYRILEANGNAGPVYNYVDVVVGSFTTSGAPSVGSTNLSFNFIEGNRGRVNFAVGDGSRRLIVARQDEPVSWIPADGVEYNADATFGDGDALGDNTFVVGKSTSSSVTLTGLTPATTYHIAVFEFNGSATNTFYLTNSTEVLTGQFSTIEPPTISTSNLTFSNILGHQAEVSFTAGSGDQRLVLVRDGAPVTDVPVNLVSYSSSNSFSSAPSLGDSKSVYRGTGSSFTLNRLEPSTTYHFAVFEFNGSNGPVYKQADPLTGSFTTAGKPTLAPDTFSFSFLEGDRFRFNFSAGNGFGRIIIAKEGAPVDEFPVDGTSYESSTTFGTASADLGNGNFVIDNNPSVGNNSSENVLGLQIGTTYHFAVIEYNGTGVNRVYMSPSDALTASNATLSSPTIQAANINFTDITANSVTINWDNGNGERRIVLLREGNPVADLPVDLTSYFSSPNYPSSPSLGSGKRVYTNTGNSVNITNIPPGEYHIAIIEYNGSSRPVYRNVDPLTGIVNVGSKPLVPASNVLFDFVDGNRMRIRYDRGDGISRLIIAKKGAPVDAFPVDFIGYTDDPNFGDGSELGTGNFVVASTTGTNAVISNLEPETEYHFAIVEVNGSGTNSFYQEASIVATSSNSTLSAPEVPTSEFFANNVTGNSLELTWTRGDGSARLILAKEAAPVNAVPTDLTNYSTSSNFGSGTSLNIDNYAVYAGSSDNFNLNNLKPNTTYHFASYEYNGNSGKVYLTELVGRASFTTEPRPSEPSSNLSIDLVNGDRFRLLLTRGNGSRRLIVVKKGGLVTTTPEDLNTYVTGSFEMGANLGEGNFVTGISSNQSFFITGLEPDTEYGVAVFEFDGEDGNERFLINNYPNRIFSTASAPVISPQSLLVNSLGSSTVNLSWTSGNGEGRMLVVRPNLPVSFVPENLNSHGSNSTNFSATSTDLGEGHKHIRRGNQTDVDITNLDAGTTYYVAVFEYNGSAQPVYNETALGGFFTTLPSTGLAIGGFDVLTFCPSQVVNVPYFFTGVLNTGNELSIELSDITGSFASPTILGTQSTTNNSGFITSTLPASLPEGTGYRLRVRSTSPANISNDNGGDIQIATSVQPIVTVTGGQLSTCETPIELQTSQPGYLLQWFKDGSPIPLATGDTYTATETGDYEVRISGASGGCQLFSDVTTLEITQRPEFAFTFDKFLCENEELDLTIDTEPIGGAFSGPGISSNLFDASIAGVGQHILTYTIDNGLGCIFEENVIVRVQEGPNNPTVQGVVSCDLEGDELQVTDASGDYTYNWYTVPTSGIPDPAQTTAVFTLPELTETTSYFVSAVSPDGCESERIEVIAEVIKEPSPVIAVNSALEFCEGESVLIQGPNGFNSYLWSDGSTTPSISVTASGTYTLEVTTDAGCTSEVSSAIEVTVIPSPPIPVITSDQINGNFTICQGESITLTATEADSYNWSNAATTQSITVSEQGTFSVVVTNSSTCVSDSSESVTVIVSSSPTKPTITSNSEDFILCEGESLTLTASENDSYLWSTGETTQSITVSEAGTFTVRSANASNCNSEISDAVEVSVIETPVKPVISSNLAEGDFRICQGESVILTATQAASYYWSTGETSQSITVSEPGSYTVSIENAEGCVSNSADTVSVEVDICGDNSPPVISESVQVTSIGSQISFNLADLISDVDGNLDLSTLLIVEQPISGAVATIQNASILNVDYTGNTFSGTDIITISVCDFAGSCAEQQIEIEVLGEVKVYNAVSPNGDGKNDIFFLEFINLIEDTQENQVIIYNRWGSKVFSVSNYDNQVNVFKGLNNNGNPLPSGIYYYEIQFKSGRAGMTGYLNLRR